jgi:acetolactate synthase-1/2/3 large subunit
MTREIRVADFVANFIKSQGVKTVFMVVGGGAMFLNDAIGLCKDLEYVPNHNEQASSISAEAYSRVNENLGVAVVTTGPGATNAITGVAGAWIESVPLLIISGQVKKSDLMKGTGVRQMGPQEVDIVSIVKPITKYAVTIMHAKDIRYELEKAIHLATTGRKGPVWVDIPLDVQASKIFPDSLNAYRDLNTSNNLISNQLIENVIKMINQSNRPIILAGHGIRLSGATKNFIKLYELLGIPVVTTWNAMDLIPSNHPLSIGKPGTVALRAPNFAIQNADLLISIGARLDNVLTAFNPQRFAKNAKRIIVDIDQTELDKFNFPIELKIRGDVKNFINDLSKATEKTELKNYNDWINKCNLWKKKYTVNDGALFPVTGDISHFHLVNELSKALPENSLIVTGSSGLGIESFYTAFENKKGQRVFLTSGLGAMGYGLPAMIGASQVDKKRLLIGIESDGSFQMNLQELLTIKSLNLNLKIFIINNGGYASIRNTQRNYFEGRYVGTDSTTKLFLPKIVDIAKSIGIKAVSQDKVERLMETINFCLNEEGTIICDIKVIKDESLWPKVAAIPQADGSIISMPLEDMSPLLPIDELQNEMLFELEDASYKARSLTKKNNKSEKRFL